MKADYLTYKRARNTSLLGLVIQLVLGLILLIYSIRSGDHAAQSGSYLVLLGIFAWLILAILFDQYRRERVEAIEAESFAATDAAASSVFEEGAGELRIAAKRLAAFNRFVVPATSLLIAGALLAIGYWRFAQGKDLVSPDNFVVTSHPMLAVVLGLALAFVGFILARFVSGMSTQVAWRPLSAGAGFAVASALVGASIAAGHFVQSLGNDSVLRVLNAVIPAAMMALGIEIVANFVWDLYRPRKPGEMPRPGFDSRILAFVAAPDRIAESVSEAINYQFGFDVTGSWFYQLLSRVFLPIVVLGVVVVWLLSSVVVVEPHQRGLLLRWGAIRGDSIGPGIHLKAPWPMDRVLIPEYIERDASGKKIVTDRTAEGIRTIEAGTGRPTKGDKPILWTEQHAENEVYFVCQPARSTSAGTVDVPVVRRAGDLALIAAEVPVIYSIQDVLRYEQLGSPDTRDRLLESVARREVMLYLMTKSVDEILGADRTLISADLYLRIERAFAGLNPDADGVPRGSGVKLLFVGAEGVHPPRSTAPNFEGVVKAQHSRESIIHKAQTGAVEVLTKVVGSVELAEQIADEIDRIEQMQSDGAAEAEIDKQEGLIEGLLARAGGQAAATILDARATRWDRHIDARRRRTQHAGFMAAFDAMPRLFMADMYFDALLEAMSDARVFIVDTDHEVFIEIDLKTPDTQIDPFNAEPEIDG